MVSRHVVRALLLRPSLWPTAVRAASAFAPSGWWRRPPFLPLPDPTVLRWRALTAYGDAEAALRPEDAVAYLRWRRDADPARRRWRQGVEG